jgi:hypothetical protein
MPRTKEMVLLDPLLRLPDCAWAAIDFGMGQVELPAEAARGLLPPLRLHTNPPIAKA